MSAAWWHRMTWRVMHLRDVYTERDDARGVHFHKLFLYCNARAHRAKGTEA